MANFTEALPTWTAAGVKPPDSIISGGWQASQKPPADYFNWFFSRTHAALREIQTKAALDADLIAHKSNKSNPHGVTAAQVGLGNVLNQKQATKVEFDSHNGDSVRHITNVERATWNGAVAAVPDLQSHTTNKSNPHEVTKAQVSLGNVLNYGIATTAEAQAGTIPTKYMTPILVSEAIKVLQAIKSVNGKTGMVVLGKSDVGLAQVDNAKQATKAEFDAHKDSKTNPHAVTAAQVGLGNVLNQKQATKVEFDSHNGDSVRHITSAERTAWNGATAAVPNLQSHAANKTNPHGVTAGQTGAYTKNETDAKVSEAKTAVKAGNVASATKLETARKIAGVDFDGSKNIAIPAANVGAFTKGEADARYIALAGNQNVTGVKNFSGLQVEGGDIKSITEGNWSGIQVGKIIIYHGKTAVPERAYTTGTSIDVTDIKLPTFITQSGGVIISTHDTASVQYSQGSFRDYQFLVTRIGQGTDTAVSFAVGLVALKAPTNIGNSTVVYLHHSGMLLLP